MNKEPNGRDHQVMDNKRLAILAMRNHLIRLGVPEMILSKPAGNCTNNGYAKSIGGYRMIQWGVSEDNSAVFPFILPDMQFVCVGYTDDKNSIAPVRKMTTGCVFPLVGPIAWIAYG